MLYIHKQYHPPPKKKEKENVNPYFISCHSKALLLLVLLSSCGLAQESWRKCKEMSTYVCTFVWQKIRRNANVALRINAGNNNQFLTPPHFTLHSLSSLTSTEKRENNKTILTFFLDRLYLKNLLMWRGNGVEKVIQCANVFERIISSF
jgi:hypothetical protein